MSLPDIVPRDRAEPLVHVIVITFNGKQHLEACFPSLSRTDYSNKLVVLADNSSNNESADFTATAFPWVKVVKNEGNLGFAKGNNRAMQMALDAGADYIVLLNDDTIILDGRWLREAVALAESDRSTGMIGYRLLDKIPDPPEAKNRQSVSIAETKRIDGCALFMRGNLLRRIGLFDEVYFAYSEEDDLEARAVRAGARLQQLDIPIYHYGGGTSKRFPLRFSYLQMRNSIRCSVKNRSLMKTLARVVKIFDITCSPRPFFFDSSDGSHVRMRGNGNILLNLATFLCAVAWNLIFLPVTLIARRRDDALIQGS